jgi:multidrug efflux pump subunit AcrB
MCGILILGVLSYIQMPKLEDPAVPVKQVAVVAIYPGATAHDVELEVAQPLEDALRTLPDIRKITTECTPGQAHIGVEFKRETPTKDLEQHFDLVRRKTADIASKLPQGCMAPIVVDDMMDVYGLFYSFTGDGYTLPELERYAKKIRRELLKVSGVKRVNIGGTRSEVIEIELSPEQIKRNGLLPTQVMLMLQDATKTVNGGTALNVDNRYNITVTDGVVDEKDIANLLIDTPEGKKVRLSDVATVRRCLSTPQRNAMYVNHKPALSVTITLDNDAIVPDVGKAVDAKLAEVQGSLPVGMEMEKIFFQPDKVDDAVSGFMLNLLESVLIVVLVLMIAMGWRSGVIIGFGLVLTVALSFPILSTLGTTLQRISLGAFIVAMGMLVDNAVVIMDGILVDRKRGLPASTYLFRIGNNTALPLLGATIIAACTFLPIYLTPGSTGEFAGDLFLVVCVSLLVSWVLALVQVPICADTWLEPLKPSTAKVKAPQQGIVYRTTAKLLVWLIDHKTVSIATAVVLLCGACALMGKVKNVFFPDFDYKQFVVECYFPEQSDPDHVRDRILQLADSAQSMDRVDRVVAYTGGAPARYCFVRPMPTGGDNYAELIVDCKDFKTMQEVSNNVREHLRDIAPEVYIRTRKYNFSISSSHTVEVEFAGPDPQVLRDLCDKAEAVMRGCEYVDAYSVENNWQPKGRQVTFNYNQSAAQRAGVNRADIGNALQAAGDGFTVGVINDHDKMVPIKITMRNADGSRLADLATIPVWTTTNFNIDPSALSGLMTGSVSPEARNQMFRSTVLSAVVDSASLRWDESYIYRYNGQRAMQAECDPDPLNPEATPAKVLQCITEQLDSIPVPAGYTMRYVGENDVSGEAIAKVLSFMPLVIIIIFLILLMLFNSWKKLCIILICFPFVICGIAPALLITNTPFTFIAILGFEGLIGMMIKNAIVLVDEITRLMTEEHLPAYRAVIQATVSRVRPVMLASFTTILGMIPLIGDPMYGSLAVTVIGGLFVGTIVTLLLLPLFYSIIFKVRKTDE